MKLTVATLLCLSLSLVRAQPPPNDDCANAIVVNPKSPVPIYGNNTLAVSDRARENTCQDAPGSVNSTGLWYKFANVTATEVVATTCNNGTNFDTVISVFVGNSCGSLSCVAFNDDSSCSFSSLASTVSFPTDANKTYWVMVRSFSDGTGFFGLTVALSPGKFSVVNPITDRQIGQLNDTIDYFQLPSSRLNFQMAYYPEIAPPRSVRMTFDDPSRNFCENTPPFSVFGDLNGDFSNATIPVGVHVMTATAYNESNCRGTAGPIFEKNFFLGSCGVYVDFIDVAYNISVDNNYPLEYLPCSLNIQAFLFCGFQPNEVKLELRNTETNTLLVSRIERTAPYYLFGDVQGKPLAQTIPPGSYSVTVVVDQIVMDVIGFVAENECAKNIPPNDACVNAIPFRLNATTPFQAIGDTTFAVQDSRRENSCGPFGVASGLWYKWTIPPAAPLSQITATTASNATNFESRIRVFVGSDCNSLSCEDYSDAYLDSSVTFFGQPNQTFWIVVSGVYNQSGVFQLKVESNPNAFFLVNPVTDRPIDIVDDFLSYEFLPVSRLNIQANYDPARPAPKSVRVTFDNPARNSCENTPPFSVFGDVNGDFFNATIPVGNHTVTATPYNGTNCGGTAGPTRSQTFSLEPCFVNAFVFDVAREVRVGVDSLGNLAYLPCSVNVGATISCGFSEKEVKLELRNTATNTLLVTRTELAAPYFIFGDSNGSPLAESLPPGAYQLKVIVDGIEMKNFVFVASGQCV